jgi:hypothetical protein
MININTQIIEEALKTSEVKNKRLQNELFE